MSQYLGCPHCGSQSYVESEVSGAMPYTCQSCHQSFYRPCTWFHSTEETQEITNEINANVLAIRISERDRLIGRLESLVLMLEPFVPRESPVMKTAIAETLKQIRLVYGDDDHEL